MQPIAWKAYDDASSEFFKTYESLNFSTMHRSFLRFLPERGALCLDVGAGSGRDAAALARRGYRVVAVEPSNGLRKLAEQHHASEAIMWIGDALPALEKVSSRQERYKFILLSAVWMHVSPDQRVQSLNTLSQLLASDGYIALTLRVGIPCNDRVMYPVSIEELLDHAQQAGLSSVYISRKIRDSLKRSDVMWQKIVLKKRDR